MHPGAADVPGLGQIPSLGARRPAASSLPPLNELPPPPLMQMQNKFQQPFAAGLAALSSHQSHVSSGGLASVGNLLTPPNTLPGDSGLTSAGTLSSNASPSFQSQPHQNPNMHYSAAAAAAQYGQYHSGTTPPAGQWIPPRGMFSPSSLDSLVRQQTNLNGGGGGNGGYELNQLPAFPTSAPYSAPSMSAAQQQQQQQHHQMQGGYAHSYPGQDHYGGRPPPTPTYLGQTQQSASYGFQSHGNSLSPANASDQHSHPSLDRVNSMHSSNSQSPPVFSRQTSYSQYSPLGAPVMSGLGQNGMMVNGIMSGYQQQGMQNMYGRPPQPQHQTPSDRPFKCDSCPQSFNRNHDLKRHKRIHLAVKPYPCGHCDKSFSRKDALKRHILVKGCGKGDDYAKRSSASPPNNYASSGSASDQ